MTDYLYLGINIHSAMIRPTPNQNAPQLRIKLTDDTLWVLNEQKPENFTLISFYRGLHCPVCKKHLQQFQELNSEFEKKGVRIIAVSMDNRVKATKAKETWNLKDLNIGYGLTFDDAKKWGLYISSGIKIGEPDIFNEPGLFLIDNKSLVYYSAMYSNPWGRPSLPYFLKGINYILETDYPPRGTVK